MGERRDERGITMSFKEDAIKKLSEKPKSLSKHAVVVKDAVIAQLKNFCEQNEEFAQAVVQSAGTVGECLENVVSGCGNSLSDVEAYSKAVAFWFPGAKISFAIKLDLGDGGTSNQVEAEFTEVQAAAPVSGDVPASAPVVESAPAKHRIVLDLGDLL